MQAVLTSWKEISKYVGKGTRTVQRWEAMSGFPVRRMVLGTSKSPVFAYPADIDDWIQAKGFRDQLSADSAEIGSLRQEIAALRVENQSLRQQLDRIVRHL
jgi:hypothetical protein